MNLPKVIRVTCSNILRQNMLRYQPRVLHRAAAVAASSQFEPIAWQRSAFVSTRRFTSATENNTVDYDYVQTIIKDKKKVNVLYPKGNGGMDYSCVVYIGCSSY